MSWFADVGALKEYHLPSEIGGGTITLRKELSIGQERDIFANAIRGTVPLADNEMRIEYDQSKLSFGQVIAYLAEWSDKAEVTPSAIKGLKPEIYEAIEKIVIEHAKEYGAKNSKGKEAATTTSDAPTLQSVA
jgi:hypothetical protein